MKIKITVEFSTDNASFDDDDGWHEMYRIAEKVSSLLQCQVADFPPSTKLQIRDFNGNVIGKITAKKT